MSAITPLQHVLNDVLKGYINDFLNVKAYDCISPRLLIEVLKRVFGYEVISTFVGMLVGRFLISMAAP